MKTLEMKRPQQQTGQREIVCSVCGMLVPEDEITMEFEGVYTNYFDRSMGRWHLAVCRQCGLKMDEIERLGEQGARARMGQYGSEML